MDNIKTGELIAAARKEKGFTQKELAAALHISDKAISNWERGIRFPDISLLESLSEQIGISPIELLKGEKTNEESLPKPLATKLMCDMANAYKSEMKRKNCKNMRIMAVVSLSLILIILFFVLYLTPFTRTVQNNLSGILIYKSENDKYLSCKVDIEGTYYHYLFSEDYFDGCVKVNGVALGGGINRYTFGSMAALTSYSGTSEKPDGTTIPLYRGNIMVNQALNAVVISTCYDQSGHETTDESERCLIIAPSYDKSSAESTLYTFAPSGLLSKFDTWNFTILF